MKITYWFQAMRPKTLVASFVPILTGTCLASMFGPISLWIFIFTLLSTSCLQIGTNFFNDVLDFKKGADTQERLGPLRLSSSGKIKSKHMYFASFLSFLLAILFAIPLVEEGGLPILIIGILSILFGYLYTGSRYSLSYNGLGEVFVLIFFGVVSVSGVFYLNLGKVTFSAVLLGLQVGFLATALIAINNLRDIKTDKKAHKKTLAVRLGEKKFKKLLFFILLAPYLLNIYWLNQSLYAAFILPMAILPFSINLISAIKKEAPSTLYNHFLAKAAKCELLFGGLLSVAFLLHMMIHV
jgi:1,4-dihydroxy-2-naphthoate octaprenyltransferase